MRDESPVATTGVLGVVAVTLTLIGAVPAGLASTWLDNETKSAIGKSEFLDSSPL